MNLPATPMLVLVTLLWGLTFPLMKEWQDQAEGGPGGEVLISFTIVAVRMTLSAALLACLQPGLLRATRKEHAWGCVVGVIFTIGVALQFTGLARTTPALSAFITSLTSAWVPLLAFVFLGIVVSGWTALAFLIGMGGAALLAGVDSPDAWATKGGELLTFLSTIPFAMQILVIDRLGKRLNPAHLTLAMLAIAGVSGTIATVILAECGPGLSNWLRFNLELLSRPKLLLVAAALVLLAAMTFHWMNVYQPRVPASRAALIYLLEPVFASIFSILAGYEGLTPRLVLGGVLILAGNFLAELPGWLKSQRGTIAGSKSPKVEA